MVGGKVAKWQVVSEPAPLPPCNSATLSMKILLVDDDIDLINGIEATLQEAGYETALAYTAEDGVRAVMTEQPDLILLDVMIPEMGGWSACKVIRKITAVPIIFLTALGNVENIVKGLEVGADDYMVKPFIEAEFLARIYAHLRRQTAVDDSDEGQGDGRIIFGDGELIIDTADHSVTVNGQDCALSQREFELLAAMATSAGTVLTVSDLISRAWGSDYGESTNLKTYIHYLRKKIETDPATPRWILTVRGIGYRFADK